MGYEEHKLDPPSCNFHSCKGSDNEDTKIQLMTHEGLLNIQHSDFDYLLQEHDPGPHQEDFIHFTK